MATVLIVDDDQFVCEHLEERLADDPELTCAGVAHDADTARTLVRHVRPDLIVLDIMLGGRGDPIDLAVEFAQLSPRSRIVVCTGWSDRPGLDGEQEFRQKSRAARSGVIDWISKGRGIAEVMPRLREAAKWRNSADARSPLEESLGDYLRGVGSAFDDVPFRGADTDLTPTESRIAATVAFGLEADMTVEEIAHAARLVLGTVRGHLKSIYSKWAVHGQAAFVAEARRRGLLSR